MKLYFIYKQNLLEKIFTFIIDRSYTVPLGNNFPIIREYLGIFSNIFEYFLIYLNTLEYFLRFRNILEYSRIKWNNNDLFLKSSTIFLLHLELKPENGFKLKTGFDIRRSVSIRLTFWLQSSLKHTWTFFFALEDKPSSNELPWFSLSLDGDPLTVAVWYTCMTKSNANTVEPRYKEVGYITKPSFIAR